MLREENFDFFLYFISDEVIDFFDFVLCMLNIVFLDVGLFYLFGVFYVFVSL